MNKHALVALVVAALSAGCGGSTTRPLPLPATPENTSPAGAIARFEAMYESQQLAEVAKLFTADFSFNFSNQSDPELVSLYGSTWAKDDEIASTGHLFDGFTSGEAPFETFGGATNIVLTLAPQIVGDLIHPDSTQYYKYAVVPNADLTITVLNGSVETIYEVFAPHDFYLVRGDAAVLDAGQPADSLHWYIRRWDDRSPAESAVGAGPRNQAARELAPMRIMPARRKSWGAIKATYHH